MSALIVDFPIRRQSSSSIFNTSTNDDDVNVISAQHEASNIAASVGVCAKFFRRPSFAANVAAATAAAAKSKKKPINIKTKKKSVQFAPMSEIQFYEKPSRSQSHELFFCKKDYQAMKAANVRAVREVHQRVLTMSSSSAMTTSTSTSSSSSTPSSSNNASQDSQVEDDDGITLAGLENLLTPALVRKLVIGRKKRSRAVLLEQARQEESGRHDIERLALVSRKFSEASVRRAERIAYSQLLQNGTI